MKKLIPVFQFLIQNQTDDSVDIHIDGDIVDASTQEVLKAWFDDTTSVSFKSFRNQLNSIKAKTFNVIINSAGGHVGDALAIHDYLVDLQNQGKIVNTKGIGIVASSATHILMAGREPEMTANSFFMVHNVSGGIYGNVDQVENYARTMRKFNNVTRDAYANKSGMRKEEVAKLMDNETWMTAQEAKEKGLIAKVTGEQSFSNKIDAEVWPYSNMEILNQYNKAVKQTEPTNFYDMKKFFTDLKNEIVNALKGVNFVAGNEQANTDMVNTIAEAISKPFQNMETEINNHVSQLVAEQVKNSDTLKPIIQAAVDAAVKEIKDANTALKGEFESLEQEVAQKLGKPTNSTKEGGVVPIGSFN